MSRIAMCLIGTCIASVTLVSVPSHGIAEKEKPLPGVKGTLILLGFDQDPGKPPEEIDAQVGDRIEMTWSYPIGPGSIPTAVAAKSSSSAVQFEEARRIVRPLTMGGGTLGAFFVAKKEGTALLSFSVKSEKAGGGVGSVTLQCRVAVFR